MVAASDRPLAGKVALVSGASKGVGRVYALSLAAAGARVAAVARTLVPAAAGGQGEDSLADVVAAARAAGDEVMALGCDISNEDDIRRLIDEVIANFGRLDVVVNNAVRYNRQTDVFSLPRDEWEAALHVNLRVPWAITREAVPHIAEQGGGSIINLTSLAAQLTEVGTRRHNAGLVYAISKAALERETTYLAAELEARNIAVNAISPGDVQATIQAGGSANAEVHGAPIVYLACQTASTLTGQILHTDTFGKSWGPAALSAANA